ncbi:MAG: hypothetical protein Q8S41_09375 [Lutibacter sp.]|nr:hypothetical protein [Lutibacter sp.]
MRLFIYIGFLLAITGVNSQNGDNLHKEDRGNIIISQNSVINGKSYLFDEWNKGMLVLNDSVFSVQDYLKFDAFKNSLFIKMTGAGSDVTEIIEIDDKSVTGFSILEKDKNIKHDFVWLRKKNFNGEAENGFYELVFNLQNTNYFIKKNSKILFDRNRSKGSQTMNNYPLEYQDKITYYIKNSDGLYEEVELKKKYIIALLNMHSKEVEAFVKLKKVNYGKESDVMKLVNYYYSL